MKYITFILFFSLITSINCHVFMKSPPSRRNKYSEYYNAINMVDYNIMAPLNTDGYSYPCKGYKKGQVTQNYTTNVIPIELEGTVLHEGGHCQFGISTDDTNFIVLKTVLDNCLMNGLNYDLELPNIPNGNYTLFWTWVNKIGNREYYMECSDISLNISNNDNPINKVTGKELLVVNLPGYPTIPEFNSPGSYNGIDLFESRKNITIDLEKEEIEKEEIEMEEIEKEEIEKEEIEMEEIEKENVESNNNNNGYSYFPSYNNTEVNDTTVNNTNYSSDVNKTNIEVTRNFNCTNDGLLECENNGFYMCINNQLMYRKCPNNGRCNKINNNIECVLSEKC